MSSINNIKGFLRAYKTVSGFSPDTTDFNDDILDSRINKEQFLKMLYSSREAVKLIRQEIFLHPGNLICIAGPRGCGKTSIGLKAKQELSERTAFRNFIIPIDVRRDDAIRTIGTDKKVHAFFTNKILNRYKRVFQPNPWDQENNPEIKLMNFILNPLQTNNKPEELFDEFVDEVSECIGIMHEYHKKTRPNDYLNFFVEKFHEIEIQNLFKRVKSKLQIIHYSFAVQEIFNYQRQVIWIDNLDKLPNEEQITLLEAVTEIKRSVTDNIVIVVAIREENIFRVEHFEDFAPPYTTTIYWENPNEFENAKTYEAFNMPVVSDEIFKDIINRRFLFSKIFQENLIHKLKEEISSLSKFVTEENIKKIKENTEIIRSLSTPINEAEIKELEILKDKVSEVILMEKGCYLSNNSLRQMLPLHRDFLLHLVEKNNDKDIPLEANKLPLWFLQTEFLYFITLHSKNSTFIQYDIVNHYNEPNTQNNSIICFCPHLVLTCIWNYCIKNIRQANSTVTLPSVEYIINTLMRLEFEKEDILKTIFRLFHSPGGKSNYITIETKKYVRDYNSIDLNSKLKINYKGKSVLNSLSISFGYFYALVVNRHGFDDKHLDPTKTVQYGNQVLRVIEEMAQKHLYSLLYIRKKVYKNSKGWLEDYYLTYGIPFHPLFSRNYDAIGKKIIVNSKYKHATYVEALLDSFIPYFSQFYAIRSNLENLRIKYVKALSGLADMSINTSEEINLLEL
ncbi:MAG: hypothetical protein GC192_20845 [Bacteroidetes bacterium]|nr:hypothetical protein [Bacteroidota bacterium]